MITIDTHWYNEDTGNEVDLTVKIFEFTESEPDYIAQTPEDSYQGWGADINFKVYPTDYAFLEDDEAFIDKMLEEARDYVIAQSDSYDDQYNY